MGCISSSPKTDPIKPTAKANVEEVKKVEENKPAVIKAAVVQPTTIAKDTPTVKVEEVETEVSVVANTEKAEEVVRAKMKRGQQFMGASVDVDSTYVKKVVPKKDEETALIAKGLADHFLFAALDATELNDVVLAMEREEIPAGTVVIQQGDKGNFFYLCQSGHFDVLVNGTKVFQYDANGGFGELALLYDCPRAASVVSSIDSVVWKLDRETFRHTLASNVEKNYVEAKSAVSSVTILKDLSSDQLAKVAEAVQIIHYKKGEKVITKGEQGSVFYMIKEGTVVCTDLGTPEKKLDDLHLGAGDYFGERALLLQEPRAASVIATSDRVTCMVLNRDQFELLLGPLKETLDVNLGLRVLQTVDILSKLSIKEKDKLVKELDKREYASGDFVITQGDPGEEFFIVKSGELKVTTTKDGEEVRVATLMAGSFFGEQALLSNAPRAANVIAISPVSVFVLARQKFEAIFGPISAVLDRVVEERKEEVHKIMETMKVTEPVQFGLEDLEQIKTLGTGTFGRVKLARNKKNNETYALKVLQKNMIVNFKQEKNVMNEKMILTQANHPFILQLLATFKDANCLYMVLELVQGGELFSLLHNNGGKIKSRSAQFYSACVLSVLGFLHDKHILYRDLKPENLLIDKYGYCKVVDFGFAKVVKDRTFTLCGTPEYLAPELVLGKGHNKGVDYWALGILIYEMLSGYSPFADHENGDQMAICRNILKGKLEFPPKLKDNESKDLIKLLLHRDPVFRLGCLKDGAEDVKKHAWYSSINWAELHARKIEAPWIPPLKGALDSSNFDVYEEDDYVEPYVSDGTNWDALF